MFGTSCKCKRLQKSLCHIACFLTSNFPIFFFFLVLPIRAFFGGGVLFLQDDGCLDFFPPELVVVGKMMYLNKINERTNAEPLSQCVLLLKGGRRNTYSFLARDIKNWMVEIQEGKDHLLFSSGKRS